MHLFLAPSSEIDTDEYELRNFPAPPSDRKELEKLLVHAWDDRMKLISVGNSTLRTVGMFIW